MHSPVSQRTMLLAAARFFLIIAAAVAIAVLAGCGPSASSHGHLAVGEEPPALSPAAEWLNTPEGRPLTLAELKGQVVVLEFFAEWCPHCQAAEPRMVALHQRHASEGLTLIGVHTATRLDRDAVRAFLAEHGATYPVALDVDGATFEAYGITGVPHVVVIGRDGRVRWMGAPSDALDAEVAAALTQR